MKVNFKQWFKRFSLPRDPMFNMRPVSNTSFGKWLIVEISANDYTILLDMLNAIRISDDDTETKGRQIVGLRYCALAMSLRTKRGFLPLNYNDERDLLWLGSLPVSEINVALNAVAEISDIPWLNPVVSDSGDSESDDQMPKPTSDEVAINPS